MSKSRSFSIYLLKEGNDASNSLKDDHRLEDSVDAKYLPEGASLFVLDNPPSPPWWKSYFGIQKDLQQTLKAAVVFLTVGDSTFAITFGHVRHNLKDTSYEYDFGLRVTLNCLDPEKLKSTDILEPSGAKRQRTQMPTDSDLTYFDFDQDTTILKSLTGKVKDEFKNLFKHATGASNIRVSSDVTPDGLTELCSKLLKIYEDDAYKTTFPGLQNISPVRDPSILENLNGLLIEAIKNKSENLSLSIPAILDYNDGLWASFSGEGTGLNYDDVFLGHYYDYLQLRGISLNNMDVEKLRKHHLNLTDSDGQPRGERHSIYKCLIFDTTLPSSGEAYHFCEGNWYLVDSNFVENLSTFLDPICAESEFPEYKHKNEGDYNESVSADKDAYICLDKKSISLQKQTAIEPCDILEIKGGKAVLHHIKRSTRSASLSHLFNQGTNSIQLIRVEDEARDKLKQHIQTAVGDDLLADFLAPIDNDNFKIVFGIITRKEPAEKSKNLPLFSRISLMRAIKDLKGMGIEAELVFIKDSSMASEGKEKKRKPKNKENNSGNENSEADAA